MNHPKTCFGVSRHNVIIPLKLTNVKDFKDGCFEYTFEINHPKPSEYMKTHHRADFEKQFISEDRPLCDKYTKFRLTLEDAKQLATSSLREERASAMREVNRIDKQLAEIDSSVAELEAAINLENH